MNSSYIRIYKMAKMTNNTIRSITYDLVKSKIIEVRDQNVIIDSDVAELYGVETKRINEAVKNNIYKFPEGYLIELTANEWALLKSKFSTSIKGGKVKRPAAFTERGLYMLATILKSAQAVATTIAIIDTFAQIKKLTKIVYQLSKAKDDKQRVKIFENSTNIEADLFGNELTQLHQSSDKKPYLSNG